MNTNWVVAKKPNTELLTNLQKALNISSATATLLVNRGIIDFDGAKLFFRPEIHHLHDPMLMKDMDVAVKRMIDALKNNEKILVYGDYDVDGTTSVSMMYLFLKDNFTCEVEYYIPDRYKEGYGVSKQGIYYAKENDFNLIITLDCGIKGEESLKLAHELGIDVIVCDHHLPGDSLPIATAILDPKRKDCPYPFKELSGCGVGFKLIQAVCSALQLSPEIAYSFLDLVTISICADIVSMTGENRVLCYYGLEILNKHPKKPGIQALVEISGFKDKILDVGNVVFGFAPRINAAGRLVHASESVKLLTATNYEDALEFAKKINTHNTNRKDVDSSITAEALEMILQDDFTKNAWSTVLFKKDWHKGVVGIVASRCIENYYRPTIILTQTEDGKAVGSARSIAGFDLYEGISACNEYLEQYGGHKHAAGLSLKIENIDLFRKKFDSIVRTKITKDQLTPCIDIDYELNFDEITPNLLKIIKQFAPFGPDNMQPVFITRNVYFEQNPKILKEEHIKFTLKQEGVSTTFEAIGFRMAEWHQILQPKMKFDICFQLMENNFRNQTQIELLLKDIKTHEAS